jgi:hypothetical protein
MYIPSRIDVPVMGLAAVRANPVSYSKRAHTFRTTVGNTPAARAHLGTVPFGYDAHHTACRNRLVRQHVAELCACQQSSQPAPVREPSARAVENMPSCFSSWR